MRFIIDRFEGNFAILQNSETSEMSEIEKTALPDEVKEGDALLFEGGLFTVDSDEIMRRTKRIIDKMDSIWEE
ncbi:MAG: DUF3006 domain-containing protein [Bacillota bacterium]